MASPRTDRLEQAVLSLEERLEQYEDDIGYLHYRIDELLFKLAWIGEDSDYVG